jgi:hypothetical protein
MDSLPQSCIYVTWNQYIAESSSVCSTVLCCLQEKERKNRNKEEKKKMTWLPLGHTSGCPLLSLHWDFPDCHVQLKADLRVGY